SVFPSQAQGSVGGEHALGDCAVHSLDDLLELLALAQGSAYAAVAGKTARAGKNQVTHTGQPGHGLRLSTTGHSQAGDFSQAAGNQGGYGVVAKAQAAAHTCSDGNHVLERSAQ